MKACEDNSIMADLADKRAEQDKVKMLNRKAA